MERVDQLVALANASEDNMLAFVRCNDSVFLNPEAVGSLSAPLPQQLRHYLLKAKLDIAVLDDIEKALKTGVIEGAANGDDQGSDTNSDGGGEFMDLAWRENECSAWSTVLRHDGKKADRGGIDATPDGQIFGPVPSVQVWLDEHLQFAIDRIMREVVADNADTPTVLRRAQALATTLCASLRAQLDEHDRGCHDGTTQWRHTLPLLLLVLHFWGDAWQTADASKATAAAEEERAAALRVAVRAASLGASMASASPEELVVHVPSDVLRTEIASLTFIASLLAQQDVASAERTAKLHSEWGIGDEEAAEDVSPSQALLNIAMAACVGDAE